MKFGIVKIAICCFVFILGGCQREHRDIQPSPTRLAIYGDAARESPLRPGGPVQPQAVVANPYNGSAYDISEGQRLFNWYNCSGCHANGGGGIGPPLIKKEWIYGGEPANLFDTIVKGRPNGMPSWGGRIPEYQIWQIVAFIRSLNGEQPKSATASRQDTLQPNPQNLMSERGGGGATK
ncbi:MAG: c-type cytochrome [Acidobacteriaceae bacterium]|nr:c-type cytochrome [Acidobacteriaceae bacterium]MBV9502024.1 c-type cytochrome [Acidobacteriaceae bacterium]